MMSAAFLADEIAADLRIEATKGDTLRLVRQFVMDAERGDVAELIHHAPSSTGDPRWDALIAGVVEDVAFRAGTPIPAWVRAPERTLTSWWFVTDFSGLHPIAFIETPAAIAGHGVFIRRASLVNV